MHTTLVYIQVKPEHIEAFIDATRDNHLASIREPGNKRFDVLQLSNDGVEFVLYESYSDAESAAAHKETSHYKVWRDKVADWLAKPRQGVRYEGLFP